MHADEIWLNELSGRVIGCGFTVLKRSRRVFLEKVHENALALELRKAGLSVVQQHDLVIYHGMVVRAVLRGPAGGTGASGCTEGDPAVG
jgi:hypothetical protein